MRITNLVLALERAKSFLFAERHGDILTDTEKDLIILASEIKRLKKQNV